LIGATKRDDIPADVRLRCYQALLAGYYSADRVLLAAMPGAIRYAGPREAVLPAVIRKNYGRTHFPVVRDPAGFGDFYRPDELGHKGVLALIGRDQGVRAYRTGERIDYGAVLSSQEQLFHRLAEAPAGHFAQMGPQDSVRRFLRHPPLAGAARGIHESPEVRPETGQTNRGALFGRKKVGHGQGRGRRPREGRDSRR